MGILYRLTSPSGKRYIGITAQKPGYRWRAHRAMAKFGIKGFLQNAIRKYGFDSFTKEVLVVANSYEYLKEIEVKAIAAFGTKAPNGYNMTDGGDGVLGVIITDDGRKRRSEAQKKSFATPERKERHKQSQQSAALRQQRSERMKQKCDDPNYRLHLSEVLKKRMREPEVIARLRARPAKKRKNDGLKNWERYRLKDIEAYRKKKREYAKTPEERAKRREIQRALRARDRDEYNRKMRAYRHARKFSQQCSDGLTLNV